MHAPLLWPAVRNLAIGTILAAACGTARAALVDAIEFYNAALDHYFVTASSDEINKLDTGFFVGWQRTGLSFTVAEPGTGDLGSAAVCRFYGLPAAGLNSHFYSASQAECAAVLQKFAGAWMLEANDVFEVFLPDFTTGQCPANSIPIYRAWNGRADSNHRYTTDPSVQLAMIALGYFPEGYGPPSMPVAMCSPTTSAPAVPVCAPTASDPAPYLGVVDTLLSHCTGNPTSYAWTGCSSTGSRCNATASAPGVQTYTVVASNANGTSVPASVNVKWQSPPPPPVCKQIVVTANSDLPVVGSRALLTASCDETLPTSFNWTGCQSASAMCYASASVAGVQTYSVSATNIGGTGAPAYVNINWQASPAPPPGFCSQFASFLYSDYGWNANAIASRDFPDDPGFAWNGVWVVKLSVPGDATATIPGNISVFEFDGPATSREMTISRTPCDFRPVDPTGNNGPLSDAIGLGPSKGIVVGASSGTKVGLAPGSDYFINVRNWDPQGGYFTCDPAVGRCNAEVAVTLPR